MRLRALLALAPAMLLSGCCTVLTYELTVKKARPIQHTGRLEAVTLARNHRGELEPHLLLRRSDGRSLHYAPRKGHFEVVPGPLPSSAVRLAVVTREADAVAWVASEDPVRRAAADGSLAEPTPADDADLDAHVVALFGAPEDLTVGETSVTVSVVPPARDRGRTSQVFHVADVVSASVHRRDGRLVLDVMAVTSSGRIRLESDALDRLVASSVDADLPHPAAPIAVVGSLEDVAVGSEVRFVERGDGSIAVKGRDLTAFEARYAVLLEIARAGDGCRLRYRLPATVTFGEAVSHSFGPLTETSAKQVGSAIAFGFLVPATVALDLVTLPVQLSVLAFAQAFRDMF